MAEFLFEVGLEEVPARMLAAAEAELRTRVVAMLGRERLSLADAVALSFSTPRRLAVLISDVLVAQDDVTEQVMGPAAKIALKDGKPAPAAEAFARKNGIDVSALQVVATAKGDYVAASVTRRGEGAAAVIARELPKELAALYWAKNMRWLPGETTKFVRPVVWMVAMLGNAIVPVAFGGKTASNVSLGHRVLGSGESFEVIAPDTWLAQLRGEFVEPEVEARRHTIRKALDRVCREVPGARWREDHALVDAVTHLTEWPTVLRGDFEPGYLALPEEVLVTVMRDHQKYFAVEDGEGRLAPHFLTVLNIDTDERTAAIIRQGNERVLRARFNDARFFWEFDRRTSLDERVVLLGNVTFQKDLGSYAAKTERVRALAATLAKGLPGTDAAALDEAARLSKADLTSELVKEFTELQGQVGGLYARAEGVSATVADAIYDQYSPAGFEGRLPRSREGVVLGIADRMDTIAGMFGLGLVPTGSKDPFALRRAANAVVRLLAECDAELMLSGVIDAVAPADDTRAKLEAFFRERLETYLREVRGFAYDTVAAVVAAGHDDVADAAARGEAFEARRSSAAFAGLAAAFKRVQNILAQAGEKGFTVDADVRTEALVGDELALTQQLIAQGPVIAQLAAQRAYPAALDEIGSFVAPLDAFFTSVMVMSDDEAVRARRLGLLSRLRDELLRVGDFSLLVL